LSAEGGYEPRTTNYELRTTNHDPRITNKENKPNLLDAQMNVSSVLTKYYENVPLRRRGENKPNQTQPVVSLSNLFPKSQNEIKLLFNKGL